LGKNLERRLTHAEFTHHVVRTVGFLGAPQTGDAHIALAVDKTIIRGSLTCELLVDRLIGAAPPCVGLLHPYGKRVVIHRLAQRESHHLPGDQNRAACEAQPVEIFQHPARRRHFSLQPWFVPCRVAFLPPAAEGDTRLNEVPPDPAVLCRRTGGPELADQIPFVVIPGSG